MRARAEKDVECSVLKAMSLSVSTSTRPPAVHTATAMQSRNCERRRCQRIGARQHTLRSRAAKAPGSTHQRLVEHVRQCRVKAVEDALQRPLQVLLRRRRPAVLLTVARRIGRHGLGRGSPPTPAARGQRRTRARRRTGVDAWSRELQFSARYMDGTTSLPAHRTSLHAHNYGPRGPAAQLEPPERRLPETEDSRSARRLLPLASPRSPGSLSAAKVSHACSRAM